MNRQHRLAVIRGSKRRFLIGGFALAGALLLPGPAFPGEPGLLKPGQKVRITAPRRIEVGDQVVVRWNADGSLYRKGCEPAGHDLYAASVDGRVLYFPRPRKSVVGKLVAVDDRTITISRGSEPHEISIPREAIERLEVKSGLPKAVGVVLGMVITGGSAFLLDDTPDFGGSARSTGLVLLTPLGALVGAGLADEWTRIPTERLRVSVVPRRGGAAGAVTVRF